ncbi:MAG: hypothetical protein ACOYIG_12610 [Acetivibrionales bacterium]
MKCPNGELCSDECEIFQTAATKKLMMLTKLSGGITPLISSRHPKRREGTNPTT